MHLHEGAHLAAMHASIKVETKKGNTRTDDKAT